MLENIKTMLNLKNDDFDVLINLYINKFTMLVLKYCNLQSLNMDLESFIENKVYELMKDKVSNASASVDTGNGNVKAVTRGDTRIEYNVAAAKEVVNVGVVQLTSSDKKELNMYRKLRR